MKKFDILQLKLFSYWKLHLIWVGLIILVSSLGGWGYWQNFLSQKQLTSQLKQKENIMKQLEQQIETLDQQLQSLKSEDQYQKNQQLQAEIKNIQQTYRQAVTVYEQLVDLRSKDQKLEQQFALILSQLADRQYSSASATITDLEEKIAQTKEKLTPTPNPQPTMMVANLPPNSGYRRQQVSTDVGIFTIDIIAADLNTTKVIVDTASESDCHNNCPVLPLAEFVARNNAFAGINGSYFCPADYPSCAGQTNTFNFLLMNKNKVYFNSEKNIYSEVPAVIFSGNSARFVSKSLEWGRDTSVDAVIANYPLLTFNGQIFFTGSQSEPKLNVKGGRSFIGVNGSTVYIGVVYNATVLESAKVMQALGIPNALNLDDGGSTALWYGGYKAGPGRNLPNAILLVKR